MNNTCIVTRLYNTMLHTNADHLQLATVCGTQVIVGLEYRENDLVLYFDSNLRLSHDYLHYNNLYSNSVLNADTTVKGYFTSNGRVKCQKLRGDFSNGFVASLSSLNNIPALSEFDIHQLYEGFEFDMLNCVDICSKYVAPVKEHRGNNNQNQPRVPASKMFNRHWDTPNLFRTNIESTGHYYIEEKIHGTSGRTGLCLCDTHRPWWKFWLPKQEWKVLSGTRRVDSINGHIREVRAEVERQVADKLHNGETLYYEIYGYNGGTEIQKGFPYDCRPGEFKAMLYRVTMTNEDGYTVDMDRLYVYNRAEELGMVKPWAVAYWPSLSVETMKSSVQSLLKGKYSYLDPSTILEGVVVWYETPKGEWTCVKAKTEEFLLLDSRNKDKGVNDVEDEC